MRNGWVPLLCEAGGNISWCSLLYLPVQMEDLEIDLSKLCVEDALINFPLFKIC
jgi:hypothetical protein